MIWKRDFLILTSLCTIISLIVSWVLYLQKDSLPLLDGFIAIFSIFGAYLTMKRALEQWIVWSVVNLLTVNVWIILILQGSNSIPTFILWFCYLILGIKFYFDWKKELN